MWKLFLHTDSAFNTSRFNEWKHALKAALHHENGQEMRDDILQLPKDIWTLKIHNWQFNLVMTVNTGKKC